MDSFTATVDNVSASQIVFKSVVFLEHYYLHHTERFREGLECLQTAPSDFKNNGRVNQPNISRTNHKSFSVTVFAVAFAAMP